MVATGPYAVVRHPGYLAVWLCLVALVGAFALWPLLVGVVALGWSSLVKRIRMEEALNLPGVAGYAEYMRRVRWRLIPWVW